MVSNTTPVERSRRRWPRVVLISLAALLALWLAWFLLQPALLAHQARSDVAAGLQQHRAAFQSAVEQDQELLSPVLGTPTGARYGYVCEVVNDDQGWIVVRYRQECALRSQSVYPVTMSVGAVQSGIAGLPGAEARFGEPWRSTAAKPCGRMFSTLPANPKVEFRGPNCPLPKDPSYRFAALDWTNLPAGVPPTDGSYVVVTRTEPISNTVLGCRPAPVFCFAPVEDPVVG